MKITYKINEDSYLLSITYYKEEESKHSNHHASRKTIEIWPNEYSHDDPSIIRFKITNTENARIYRVSKKSLEAIIRHGLLYYKNIPNYKEVVQAKVQYMVEQIAIDKSNKGTHQLGLDKLLEKEFEEIEILDFFSRIAPIVKNQNYESTKDEILTCINKNSFNGSYKNLRDYDLSAGIYVNRFLVKYPFLNKIEFLPSLKLAAFCLTVKFVLEENVYNSQLATYELVDLPTLHKMERIFMKGLNYQFFISKEEFMQLKKNRLLKKLSEGFWTPEQKKEKFLKEFPLEDFQLQEQTQLVEEMDLTDLDFTKKEKSTEEDPQLQDLKQLLKEKGLTDLNFASYEES